MFLKSVFNWKQLFEASAAGVDSATHTQHTGLFSNEDILLEMLQKLINLLTIMNTNSWYFIYSTHNYEKVKTWKHPDNKMTAT